MRAASTLVALLGVLASAALPVEPLRLEWNVHPGCPEANAFWSALVARSDRARRPVAGEEGRNVSVEIVRLAAGSVGRVSIEGAEPRSIAGATCSEVVDAAAIVTALVIDPSAATPTSSATPEVSPPPPPPPPVVETAVPLLPPPPPPPPPPSKPWLWSIGYGVEGFTAGRVGAVLTTPISVELARDVAVRLNFARGRSDVLRNVRGPAARFVWSTARADLCLPRGPDRISLMPCAGLEAGVLAGEPTNVDRPHSDQRFWLAGHLLSRVSVALPWKIFAEIEAGAGMAFTRPEFYVDPDYFIYEPALFVFHARAGLAVQFE